jgi:hypothetical protein
VGDADHGAALVLRNPFMVSGIEEAHKKSFLTSGNGIGDGTEKMRGRHGAALINGLTHGGHPFFS